MRGTVLARVPVLTVATSRGSEWLWGCACGVESADVRTKWSRP
jgi:hypothetical protein